MLENGTTIDDFIKCVAYDLVPACEAEMIRFRTIHFDFNKYNIRDDMKPLLDEAVSIINENECCYLIEGHTDSIGSLKYNQKLSERPRSVRLRLPDEERRCQRLQAEHHRLRQDPPRG